MTAPKRRFIIRPLLSLTAVAGILIFLPASVQAQATQPKPATSGYTGYTFFAGPGDSLSYFARRAIQLNTEAASKPLPKANALFAEANIVKELGGHYLEIGDKVEIPAALTQKWVNAAVALSPQQAAAWQAYVSPAIADVSYIRPAATSPGQQQPQAQTPPPAPAPQPSPTPAPTPTPAPAPAPTPAPAPSPAPAPQPAPTPGQAPPAQPPTDQPPAGESAQENLADENKNDRPGDQPASDGWYWWLIGVGVLGAIYFVLGGPSSKNTTARNEDES